MEEERRGGRGGDPGAVCHVRRVSTLTSRIIILSCFCRTLICYASSIYVCDSPKVYGLVRYV